MWWCRVSAVKRRKEFKKQKKINKDGFLGLILFKGKTTGLLREYKVMSNLFNNGLTIF